MFDARADSTALTADKRAADSSAASGCTYAGTTGGDSSRGNHGAHVDPHIGADTPARFTHGRTTSSGVDGF